MAKKEHREQEQKENEKEIPAADAETVETPNDEDKEYTHHTRRTRYGKPDRSRNVFWGVFLIFLGITLLLNSLGVIPWTIWHDIWQYWPFLLIIAGIQVLLGSGPGSDIVIVVLSVVFFISVFTKTLVDIQSPLVHEWGLDKLPWIEFLKHYTLK